MAGHAMTSNAGPAGEALKQRLIPYRDRFYEGPMGHEGCF